MRRSRALLWLACASLVAGCAPERPTRTRGLEPIQDSGHGIEVPDGGAPGLFDQGTPPGSPDPGPGCGNGVVDPGELCDGDLKSCSAVDAETYSGGVATCNAGCSGYDLSACVKQAPKLGLDDAVSSITVAQLKQDLGTLASDSYNGRYPGSAGDQQTRSYIIAAFKAAGVGPGPGGSYQQSFSWNGIQTANVVGVLAGNDASLKDELVIVGAHHDHLGTTANYGCSNAGGSSVCNGADDNASGTVAVLAIARALAQLKGQNQRTLVFLLFGAEEEGLVGSSHYVNKAPLYPLSKTQYMINLDMLGYSTGTVQALGATRSQLAASWIGAAAAKHGVTATTTFSAGAGSDHYHFALAGVPYVFFYTPGDPCYHATCDTADKIHYTEYAAITRLAARLMWTVSQASTSPRSDFQQPTAAVTPSPPLDWKLFQDTLDHR